MSDWRLGERQRAWLIGTVAASAVGYLGFSLWGGWDAVAAAIADVGVGGVAILLALSLANYALRFVRWQGYLGALGARVPAGRSALIYVAGFALTTTPGKAGEMLRGVFLKAFGMSYARSTAAFLSERMSDLLAVIALGLLGFTLFPQGRWLLWISVAAVVAGLLILTNAWQLARRTAAWAESTSRVRGLVHRVLGFLAEARVCHTPRLLVWATALSVVAWGAEAYGFYLLLGWMGQDTTLAFACTVYALAMLAGALSFLPGGLGGAEAMMVGMLLWAGVPEAQAVAATLIVRLATLWFAVALGAATLALARTRLAPEPA